MRNIYLSFLGLGAHDKEKDRYDYNPTIYELDEVPAAKTRFVQVAEMELLGGKSFDFVLILCTRQSYDAHFEALREEMAALGVTPHPLIIPDDLGPEGQWILFEQLLSYIEHKDRLSVDLTHGFRSTSVIFSAAINFLQRAKAIELAGVYYGAFEVKPSQPPIVDMKDFYVVNEWAEAVSRLVDDADARKMADVAVQSSGFQAGELNDKELITALEDLTNAVRNVEVNTVAERANKALDLVEQRRAGASITGKLLLGLVVDKFTSLSTQTPVSGRYDADYFHVQLAIARLLLEHKLYMQAYTVMREFVASLAMIPRQEQRMTNRKGRDKRAFLGEIFVQMVDRPLDKWIFLGERQTGMRNLKPLYDELERLGVVDCIRGFMNDLTEFRNGFDHAWTAKIADFMMIKVKGDQILAELEAVLDMIRENGLVMETRLCNTPL